MKVDCRIRAGSRNIPRRSAGRSGAGSPREEMAEVVRTQVRGLEGDGGVQRGAGAAGGRGAGVQVGAATTAAGGPARSWSLGLEAVGSSCSRSL